MGILELLGLASAGWTLFRVIDRDNLYLGLRTTKEDLKDLSGHAKFATKLAVQAAKTSKKAGQARVLSEQVEYTKSGKTWESEEFLRSRERATKLKSFYEPNLNKLKKEEEEAIKSIEESKKLMDSLA
jgi:hypothetical protein